MRVVSSKESVARGEVSILAIIETLLAVILVFYLSAHFNTLSWLAVTMCVSPLLLLRTEKSTRLGIEWWDLWVEKIVDPWMNYTGWNIIKSALGVFAWVLGPPIIRIGATVTAFGTRPGDALKAVSTNWARITLATDSRQPPELIPDHQEWNLQWFVRILTYEPNKGPVVWKGFIVFFSICIFFLPALFYRWSLKATSIIYGPLVFVAHSTFSESTDLRTKLELIKRGDLSRIRVWYGVIAITTFLVKLLLMMNLPSFTDWWNEHPVSSFLALYVAPAEIPKWQLAELANSALAIGATLFARHALLRYDLNHPWPEKPVKRLLGFVSGLRWVLALYAILCTGYITMRAAQHWHWPALGEHWLPR